MQSRVRCGVWKSWSVWCNVYASCYHTTFEKEKVWPLRIAASFAIEYFIKKCAIVCLNKSDPLISDPLQSEKLEISLYIPFDFGQCKGQQPIECPWVLRGIQVDWNFIFRCFEKLDRIHTKHCTVRIKKFVYIFEVFLEKSFFDSHCPKIQQTRPYRTGCGSSSIFSPQDPET